MSRLAALRKNGPRGIGYKLFVNPSYHTMGRRRVGVAITALALLALAWSPLGVEASRAQIEGDGARRPRREGPLGAVPSADGWEDRVPESSAGWVSDVYWRRRSRVTRASEEDVGEDEIN